MIPLRPPRYFTLQGGFLSFKDPDKHNRTTALPMSGSEIVATKKTRKRDFVFRLNGPLIAGKRVKLILAAASAADQSRWVSAMVLSVSVAPYQPIRLS